jgi:hypothetical protein
VLCVVRLLPNSDVLFWAKFFGWLPVLPLLE